MNRHQANSAVVEKLRDLPQFSECSIKELTELAKRGRVSSVPARWELIHQRTPGDAAYVILDGTVDITVDGAPVTALGAGEIVGRWRSSGVAAATPAPLPPRRSAFSISRRPTSTTWSPARVFATSCFTASPSRANRLRTTKSLCAAQGET